MIISMKPLEKDEIAMMAHLANDVKFKQFRNYLTRSLEYLREQSDEVMDIEKHEWLSKGARQLIVEILNATDAEKSKSLYARTQE